MESVSCAIALGSNLGDSVAILQGALAALNALPQTELARQSRLYRTKPVGPPQPDYLNGCALVTTRLTPEVLLQQLLTIERRFGRIRRERWGPRQLDLDLLLWDDIVLQTPSLQIPHPRMHERAFVLVPLAEIAADWVDPRSGQTIQDLAQQVGAQDVWPLTLAASP
ncbi:2-amino-4-hydroxy-6-hydroxymethyldihydropteridine pyrophosphokinase [Halomicronema hongdechloris C2206]|uniref:2-amino-4-hydroxy-6-hydroxymethyldihydropteridine diphosphokinase n=1 Tax=Halomicronema hongdechloris C2206 TaxID=1641165 RepID=A0A1Z3HIZ5_9CYAN|nr:2-amino-4-hydroxy-6-hydroxymethyldihydropteridine diphosphokinase [Halomicronema hongdechloris]ASC70271.1 2-amino-4-hydroxy-6-hydroxymethyldihydropteridine pyrophosphokinase [Halomicronema hongdechloris C2206]